MDKKLKPYTPKQRELILAYIRGAQKYKRHLSRAEMNEMGFSRDCIRAAFTSLQGLKEEVKKLYPEEIENLVDEQILNPERSGELKRALKKHKTFVVTTVVDGAPVDQRFFESIKTFCKKNDALLLIMPSDSSLKHMDPSLAAEHWILEDTELNSNFRLCSIKISPKAVAPTTSLQRIGQREGSMAVASPKQFLEFVAVGNEKAPHAVMSTGALTMPRYFSSKGEVRRTDYIANHDHVMGAIIVEIVDDSIYHFRQIQADNMGKFYDLGTEYCGKKTRKVAPLCLRFGDVHVGESDPMAVKAGFEMAAHTGVKEIIWEDVFSGISINHHEEDNHLLRAMLFERNQLILEDELKLLGRAIDTATSTKGIEKLTIVFSNHHEFLTKHYLPKGKYKNDPQNYRIAHRLALAMMDGKDPLQYYCEEIYKLKNPEKVNWLKRDQDYKIGGVQQGAHGDKGANGSKGSKRTLENAYGQIMHGHTHSPYIFRGVWCVGTTSFLRVGYNEGANGWVQCHGFTYENGMRQLVNIFNGKWKK